MKKLKVCGLDHPGTTMAIWHQMVRALRVYFTYDRQLLQFKGKKELKDWIALKKLTNIWSERNLSIYSGAPVLRYRKGTAKLYR